MIYLNKNLSWKLALSLMLMAMVLTLAAFLPSVIHPNAANTEVALSGEKIEQADPAVADFDGDGDLEIVLGGIDGMLYVMAYSGNSWSVVWSRQIAADLNAANAPSNCANTTKSDIRSAPAIADLDNDGKLEIVVTTGGDPGKHRNGGVLVYHYNRAWSFSVMSGWPQPKLDIVGSGGGASNPDGCWDGIWGSPALGDLDGDGDLEIVVEGFDRRIHAWEHNGSYVTGWPISGDNDGIHRGGWSSPALADIDEDGLPEVIVGSDDYPDTGHPPYYFYAFNGDSSLVPGFPIVTSQNTVSSPAIGDINGDGRLDIVVGTGGYESAGGHKVYAWDYQGNDLPGWPRTTRGDMSASPALGDLDGDGDLEVVIGCGKENDAYSPAPCQYLYAFHGDGSNVGGFPMIPVNNTGFPWASMGLPYTPILADYDGDGMIEILVLNRWSFGLSTVESNGQSNNNPAFIAESTLGSSPVVADVDNDGFLEIVIGGMSRSGRGRLYIWDVAGRTYNELPWPMFHHNVARTGLAEQSPKLSNLNSITFLHQIGNNSPRTHIQQIILKNEGGGSFDWTASHNIANLTVTPNSGVVNRRETMTFSLTVSAAGSGFVSGWNDLGNVTVTATADGEAIEGAPQVIPVRLYIGNIEHVYLPVIMR